MPAKAKPQKREHKRLTDLVVRNLRKRAEPVKVPDGDGMWIVILPSGDASIRYRYKVPGFDRVTGDAKMVEKTYVIGLHDSKLWKTDADGKPLLDAYQKPIQDGTLTLARARDIRDGVRKSVKLGNDPTQSRKAAKLSAQTEAANSFKSVATAWLALHEHHWSPRFHKITKRYLERRIYPDLGSSPVATITAGMVLRVLRKIEKTSPVTAHKVLQAVSGVFRHGVAGDHCESDPCRDLRDALRRPKDTRNFPAPVGEDDDGNDLTKDLPRILRAIRDYSGHPQVRIALQLSPYVMLRPDELRNSKWGAIDLDREFQSNGKTVRIPTWTIARSRQKSRRTHLVPLAPQVVRLLRELQQVSGNDGWMFPSLTDPRKPMGVNAVLHATYDLGLKGLLSPHGCRRVGSTLLNEAGFNSDWIEAQLSHAPEKVRASYNAARWIEQRYQMLCDYANMLDTLRDGAKVIPIKKHKGR